MVGRSLFTKETQRIASRMAGVKFSTRRETCMKVDFKKGNTMDMGSSRTRQVLSMTAGGRRENTMDGDHSKLPMNFPTPETLCMAGERDTEWNAC